MVITEFLNLLTESESVYNFERAEVHKCDKRTPRYIA